MCSFANRQVGIEAKAGSTVSSSFFDGLRRLSAALPDPLAARLLVHDGEQEYERQGVVVTHPRGFVPQLVEIEQNLQSSSS